MQAIVRSLQDISSCNITDALLASGGWEDRGEIGGFRYRTKGDSVMVEIPSLHIDEDGLDAKIAAAGWKPDVMIFPSEHAAASGMPALTVHPIGNYADNSLGGKERTLVPSAPALMSDALRLINKKGGLPGFSICYEATHHGPYLTTPTFFIEIGSDEKYWDRKDAAALQASVIEELPEGNDYPVAIGIGGGHYAPRFTELALSRKVNFGHMLPNYRTEGATDDEVVHMMREASEKTGTKLAFLHRKSMNGQAAARLTNLAESIGLEVEKKDCFDPLDPKES
jgi:D-aminoacyl-tRNA deacylase